MPSRALVVDANILVRAVLGNRVRGVIEAYAEDVSFFVPEVAFAEAEEHLPALVIKRGNDPGQTLAFLHTLGRKTGRFWQPHWRLAAPSGQKIPISSDAGSPHEPPAACRCFCAAVRSSPECRGSESGRRQVGPADCRLGSRQAWSRPWKRGGLRS